MIEPSTHARVCDLLGEDPRGEQRQRPTVRQALRVCGPGEVVAARHRGREVAVFVLGDGRAFAAADRCPHDGGLLSDGFVEGERLVCARHGWEFDPCTGRCPMREATIAVIPIGRRRR
ncbi:MAG TPA: Rieske 2Fe-2S domain-containing protein [Kofleriaceae bacterium]|nr:Rieske 2Fe-2S domain-containing protein [Kofleriaceae bacterium]